jgi:hypothetical protein
VPERNASAPLHQLFAIDANVDAALAAVRSAA